MKMAVARGAARSGGRFRAEQALEARANKLNSHDLLTVGERRADVHDASLCFKVAIVAAGRRTQEGDADLKT